MNKRVCKEDQIKLIMECRQSGLSDYQWCEQNGIQTQPREGYLAAELQIGNITLRLFNGADENLIQNTLRCIGGMNHAW